MSSNSKWVGSAFGVAVVALAGYFIFRSGQQSHADICHHSDRVIQPGVLTIGEFEGKTQRFCCPACALTTALQTGKPVRMIRLTDFDTHQPLEPKAAFLVRGSDTVLCTHPHPLTDDARQPLPVEFDRCLPSLLAFGTREAAEAFRQEHGGELLRLADLSPHLTVP
ncbi:MAG: hypothetical protein HY647_02750 [Acidobacteria bacterium]|nr:hypothetical protein [Acidobacteriota bacterium]